MERYTVNQFSDNWISTIGIDFRAKVISIGEKTVKLQVLIFYILHVLSCLIFLPQIWDTAGQERYRTIVAGYYRGAHAIVLVYDLTDKTSFRDVITWMHEIEKVTVLKYPSKLLIKCTVFYRMLIVGQLQYQLLTSLIQSLRE